MAEHVVTTFSTFSTETGSSFLVPKSADIEPGGASNPLLFDTGSTGNLVTIKGTLHGDTAPGLYFDNSPENLIRIGAHARIIADNQVAAYFDGGVDNIYNAGLIRGIHGVAIDGGPGNVLENTGRIVATIAAGQGVTIGSAADASSLHNAGVIRSDPATASLGVKIEADGCTVENDGRIVGGLGGVHFEGNLNRLINHGKIVGTQIGVGLSDNEFVENFGLIKSKTMGGDALYSDATGPSAIFNHGRLVGNVELGAGDDTLENSGKAVITGEVDLGAGADTFRGTNGADIVNGGDDGDDIAGGRGDDELYGDAGSDRINGGRGDDTIQGGTASDVFAFTGKHPGKDRLLAYEDGTDLIDLTAYGLGGGQQANFIAQAQHHHNGHLVIDLGWIPGVKDGKIVFAGFNTELTAGDFDF